MKQFIVKSGSSVTVCNLPITESNAVVIESDLSNEDMDKLTSATYDKTLVDGRLVFNQIVPTVSPEEQRRAELKTLMTNGTATDVEIKEALKLIL